MRIGFRLNGSAVEIGAEIPASMTLLRWLRGSAGLTGTKEACAEGECGACTVVLEDRDGRRTPVYACLLMLGQLHGTSVRTVEGLRGEDGGAHPVQIALAEGNATQCGFCTPGFVMAAWAYAREGGDPHEALAGNVCRCTGYRPIVAALERLDTEAMAAEEAGSVEPITSSEPAVFTGGGCVFHRPTELDALLALRAARPAARLVAGGTDLGVEVADGPAPGELIGLQGVAALQRIVVRPDGLLVGAAAPYAHLLAAVREAAPLGLAPVLPMLVRLGSRQIRGLGTLGGKLGTASSVGDMAPTLLALGATVRLRSASGARELTIEAFLLGHRQNALSPDEIIVAVWLPAVPDTALLVCEKLSRRYDHDVAAVSATFLIERDGGMVTKARLAFVGMGPKPARAARAEAALEGAAWSQATLERAATALAEDFAPHSDVRGSAAYRLAGAAGLLRRLWWRSAGMSVEVQDFV